MPEKELGSHESDGIIYNPEEVGRVEREWRLTEVFSVFILLPYRYRLAVGIIQRPPRFQIDAQVRVAGHLSSLQVERIGECPDPPHRYCANTPQFSVDGAPYHLKVVRGCSIRCTGEEEPNHVVRLIATWAVRIEAFLVERVGQLVPTSLEVVEKLREGDVFGRFDSQRTAAVVLTLVPLLGSFLTYSLHQRGYYIRVGETELQTNHTGTTVQRNHYQSPFQKKVEQ